MSMEHFYTHDTQHGVVTTGTVVYIFEKVAQP